jgi:cytochrome c oxidase subunit 4
VTEAMTETADAEDAHDVHHPSDWEYVKIAAWLALFTLIEVGTYFESVHQAPRWTLFVALSFLMIVKFVMVGSYFMHLKFDTPWFRTVFTTGIVLALLVYGAFLFTYDIFGLG